MMQESPPNPRFNDDRFGGITNSSALSERALSEGW